MTTIAVYGGSFDPPHLAHVLAGAYVLSAYTVDELLVVPAGHHPFDKPLSPFEHRLRMCELAFRPLRGVSISTVEHELAPPSLTLRTLEELGRRYPGAQLRLVIGSDILPETSAWHRFDRVAELAPPIVIARRGHEAGASGPALPDISSTEARRRLRAGEDTHGILDPRVAEYARAHALYT